MLLLVNYKTVMILFQVEIEARLARMVCKLIFVWGLAWTPYAIMALWAMFFQAHNMAPLMGVIPLLFCKCSAVANVMLYGIRYASKLFTLIKSWLFKCIKTMHIILHNKIF